MEYEKCVHVFKVNKSDRWIVKTECLQSPIGGNQSIIILRTFHPQLKVKVTGSVGNPLNNSQSGFVPVECESGFKLDCLDFKLFTLLQQF